MIHTTFTYDYDSEFISKIASLIDTATIHPTYNTTATRTQIWYKSLILKTTVVASACVNLLSALHSI